MRDAPLIYNIETGLPFADSLARGILEMAAGDPLALSEYLVLLPSRRACRTLRDAFLRLSGGRALLLPRLQPIGDVDAEEAALLSPLAADIPPAAGKLSRQIMLAHCLMRAGMAQSFDQAAALAIDLGNFLDEVQTEGLSFDALPALVDGDYADHWKQTLAFLSVLTEHWPQVLAERGLIDHAQRRNLLLRAQAGIWRDNPPQTPVIAAGSTGAVPAARELLALAARLPRGMLVLPGLDTRLDAAAWDVLGEDHPQYDLRALLQAAGAARADVRPWPLESPPAVNHGRVRLLREATRPAETTEEWRRLTPQDIPEDALRGFTRIDCATPQEEADVIALILRETLEEKGRTAALVTPDRRLARRVVLALKRWGIDIDDSGGQPLSELAAGSWLMLCAELADDKCAPVTLLSLLKHPLMAAELPTDEHRFMVQSLDELVLRGPRPPEGLDGLRAAIAALSGKEKLGRLPERLLAWLDHIVPRIAPFAAHMAAAAPFADLLTAHVRMAEDLAAIPGTAGGARLWKAEAGQAASDLLHELAQAARDIPPLSSAQYVAFLKNMFKGVTVRSRGGSHPRLFILGQIESRLYVADRVVLGGLNEGTWPALPAHDPWMSRPMRRRFGLPQPERSISLAAHDFVQAAAAGEVFITRAAKVDGAPAVPARWLLRIDAVLQAAGRKLDAEEATTWRGWRRALDRPDAPPCAIARPAPCPPVAARPRKLPITRIEDWMRDPYQIYARYILDLHALDPIDAEPGGAERGNFIHKALENFIRDHADALPRNAEEVLREYGRAALQQAAVTPEVAAFWWPRFERIVPAFLDDERAWRDGGARPLSFERLGEYSFDTATVPFTLTGKIDRIDETPGGYAVIDYKSGHAPGKKDVARGLSPQLPLGALMLARGGFPDVPPAAADRLLYWRVTGSGALPAEQKPVTDKDVTAAQLVQEAEEGLHALIAAFDNPDTPYHSQPVPENKPRFSDYDHLARVREWSVGGDDDDGSGEEAA